MAFRSQPDARFSISNMSQGSERMIEGVFGLGTLILGAGRSVRMGRPKLLLPWGETSILGHLLMQWKAVGAKQIMVAHAVQDSAMLAELDRLKVIQPDRVSNPAPEAGMMSSILCGAQSRTWQPALTHFAVVLGDQPHLRQRSLNELVSFAHSHPEKICQPAYLGHLRHPVVLPKKDFEHLGQSNEGTLKQFLSNREIATFECDDPGLELDIDRPEDYERALTLGRAIAIEGDGQH